jgi:hypothetical protein
MKLTRLDVENVLANVVFYCMLLILGVLIAPVHELFHAIPCMLAGEVPIMRWAAVNCNGIFDRGPVVLFFYFMGPYMFFFLVLIGLYFLAKRWKTFKWLIPIPVLEILINFFSSPQKSDFSDLLFLTFPNVIPFMLGIVLVIATILLTVKAYREHRILDLRGIIEKYKL